MKFQGDIIITDPCYIMKEDTKGYKGDWSKCNYGSNMEVLGIHNYLTRSTEYGDWSCTTFENKTKKVLGRFCADAGLVSVFLLSEVLKYNPKFDYHLERDWTTTWIKDFDGDVEIKLYKKFGVRVIGKGNINFFTSQTGF